MNNFKLYRYRSKVTVKFTGKKNGLSGKASSQRIWRKCNLTQYRSLIEVISFLDSQYQISNKYQTKIITDMWNMMALSAMAQNVMQMLKFSDIKVIGHIQGHKVNKRPKGPHIVHLSTMCHLFEESAKVDICLLNSPKNTNLVEDFDTLFPVKFCWIPFSGFRGKVENVSANQRPGRPSCFSERTEKHKLGRGRWDLASCQVSLNSVQRFQRRSRKCLSQSEARAAILFFRLARKTQTW